MKKQDMVITISREYGTGGHDIGKRLAALLNVPFYDSEIVKMTAQQHNLDEDRLNEMENQSKNPLPFGLGGFGAVADSDDRMFILQSQTILELAQKPCVIVGRCADYVLQDNPNRYSIFLYSSLKARMENIKKFHPEQNPATETVKMDRRRAAYYKYHTGQEWGQPSNYHLCMDTSTLGPKAAQVLADVVRAVQQERERT